MLVLILKSLIVIAIKETFSVFYVFLKHRTVDFDTLFRNHNSQNGLSMSGLWLNNWRNFFGDLKSINQMETTTFLSFIAKNLGRFSKPKKCFFYYKHSSFLPGPRRRCCCCQRRPWLRACVNDGGPENKTKQKIIINKTLFTIIF